MIRRNKTRSGAVIVITGGMGAGKTTVGQVFAGLGARVVDVDRLARTLYAPGTPAWHDIVRVFCGARLIRPRPFPRRLKPSDFSGIRGRAPRTLPWCLAPSGAIRRDRLGEAVFARPRGLAALNRLLHPRLRTLLADTVRRLARSGRRPLVLDMAVYPEPAFRGLAQAVVWVTAARRRRERWLAARGRWSREQIRRRIRAQGPEAPYRRIADVTLTNTGSRRSLAVRARAAWPRLLAVAQRRV